MGPFVLWCFSANAAAPDLAHPEALAEQSAQQLVDLSGLESASMTVWFDGPSAPRLVLGDAGAEALQAYVVKSTPGTKKDTTARNAEAARLVASMRFDLRLKNDPHEGVTLSVPYVHWGELEDFHYSPDRDTAVRQSTLIPLWSLLAWSQFHLTGAAWSSPGNPIVGAVDSPTGIEVSVRNPSGTVVYTLEHETLVPISVRLDKGSILYRFVKSGERNMLSHVDNIIEGKLVRQDDFTFAEVDGIPWPKVITWRERTEAMPTMHFGHVVLYDDFAPYVPKSGR